MARIRRAIMSCHDKAGLVELAKLLASFDVEIISTAGTLRELREAGIDAVSLADFTGMQEMMDGRVKSLHPKVHAGLLGLRDNKLHFEQLQANECAWIDLAVVNLHPVQSLIAKPGITLDEVIEQIDIGGATMIRSAAKNFRYVTVVVDPRDYTTIMHEVRAHDGEITYPTRYRLACTAFAHTAEYDAAIAQYLSSAQARRE